MHYRLRGDYLNLSIASLVYSDLLHNEGYTSFNISTAMYYIVPKPVMLMLTQYAIRSFSLTFLCTFLWACSTYEVSLNNQVLYTPPPLYSDYKISDLALSDCVKSTIQEQQIVKPEQLEELLCPPGNIKSLSDLRYFTNIKKLGVANNDIESLQGLEQLKELQRLDVSGNNIRQVLELNILTKLVYLDLRKNSQLICEPIKGELLLDRKGQSNHFLPQHCLH